MARIARPLALALISVAALALAPAAAPARPLPAKLAAKVDRLANAERRQSEFPGLVVGVVAPGRGTYLKAYGTAALADERAMAPGDRFRLGSVTKTFTATVVLRLVQQGRLDLDDRLSEWYPDFPNAGEITIRMLLNHTSGVPDTPASIVERWENSRGRAVIAPAAVIRTVAQLPPAFPPGTSYLYSNTNYTLLGQIAERVTGKRIQALYRRWIFKPLALDDTAYLPNARLPEPNARGYLIVESRHVDTTNWSFSWVNTAGAMTSTVPDLLRYAPALATGRGLLSRATQRLRLGNPVDTGQSGMRYGLGIFTIPVEIAPGRFQPLVGHDGEIPGYNSIVLYSPKHRASFVVLGNTSPTLDVEQQGVPAGTLVAQLAAEIYATLY